MKPLQGMADSCLCMTGFLWSLVFWKLLNAENVFDNGVSALNKIKK